MIGTTVLKYCKEKAMGIIADWLQILAIIIGVITGIIQGKVLLYQGKNSRIGEIEIHEGF